MTRITFIVFHAGIQKKKNSRVRGIFVCLTGVGVRGLIFGICSIYEFIKFEFNSGFRPLPTPPPLAAAGPLDFRMVFHLVTDFTTLPISRARVMVSCACSSCWVKPKVKVGMYWQAWRMSMLSYHLNGRYFDFIFFHEEEEAYN